MMRDSILHLTNATSGSPNERSFFKYVVFGKKDLFGSSSDKILFIRIEILSPRVFNLMFTPQNDAIFQEERYSLPVPQCKRNRGRIFSLFLTRTNVSHIQAFSMSN